MNEDWPEDDSPKANATNICESIMETRAIRNELELLVCSPVARESLNSKRTWKT